MNNLPRTVTRQRRGCDLNPGPSAPESPSSQPHDVRKKVSDGRTDRQQTVALRFPPWMHFDR